MKVLLRAALALLMAAATLMPASASAEGDPMMLEVRPGESIQAAVDAAPEGATIVVRQGVYTEAVRVRTNNITLRGAGATIRVPDGATHDCIDSIGTVPAVTLGKECTLGDHSFAPGEPAPVDQTVGFSISGFKLEGGGGGVWVLNATDVTVRDNSVRDGDSNGIFLAQVDRYEVTNNRVENVSQVAFPAVMLIRTSLGEVSNNRVLGNDRGNGINLTESFGVNVLHNHVSDSCGGIAAVFSSQVLVAHNVSRANNRTCPGAQRPYGLLVGGFGDDITVENNRIYSHNDADGLAVGTGVVDFDLHPLGFPAVSSTTNVTIRNNESLGNDIDVVAFGVQFLPPGVTPKEPGDLVVHSENYDAAWVISGGERQWVSAECRAVLEARGRVTAEIRPFEDIKAVPNAAASVSCDQLTIALGFALTQPTVENNNCSTSRPANDWCANK